MEVKIKTCFKIYISLFISLLLIVTLFPTRSPKRSKKRRTTYTPQKPNIETNFSCPWDGEG
jgi:hypothetical protein